MTEKVRKRSRKRLVLELDVGHLDRLAQLAQGAGLATETYATDVLIQFLHSGIVPTQKSKVLTEAEDRREQAKLATETRRLEIEARKLDQLDTRRSVGRPRIYQPDDLPRNLQLDGGYASGYAEVTMSGSLWLARIRREKIGRFSTPELAAMVRHYVKLRYKIDSDAAEAKQYGVPYPALGEFDGDLMDRPDASDLIDDANEKEKAEKAAIKKAADAADAENRMDENSMTAMLGSPPFVQPERSEGGYQAAYKYNHPYFVYWDAIESGDSEAEAEAKYDAVAATWPIGLFKLPLSTNTTRRSVLGPDPTRGARIAKAKANYLVVMAKRSARLLPVENTVVVEPTPVEELAPVLPELIAPVVPAMIMDPAPVEAPAPEFKQASPGEGPATGSQEEMRAVEGKPAASSKRVLATDANGKPFRCHVCRFPILGEEPTPLDLRDPWGAHVHAVCAAKPEQLDVV